jgi:4a-hydroxytetrahydrobiopterin dehydratase
VDNVPKPRDAFKGEARMSLKDKRCVPCEGGTPPLDELTTRKLLGQVSGWAVVPEGDQPRLRKRFDFVDFLAAMAFIDKLAAVAEEEAHHPDFCVHYSRVDVTLWTHAVSGLSENDFILAAKIDGILA